MDRGGDRKEGNIKRKGKGKYKELGVGIENRRGSLDERGKRLEGRGNWMKEEKGKKREEKVEMKE